MTHDLLAPAFHLCGGLYIFLEILKKKGRLEKKLSGEEIRVLGLNSSMHAAAHNLVTPVPRDSGLLLTSMDNQTCIWCTYIHADETVIYINKV